MLQGFPLVMSGRNQTPINQSTFFSDLNLMFITKWIGRIYIHTSDMNCTHQIFRHAEFVQCQAGSRQQLNFLHDFISRFGEQIKLDIWKTSTSTNTYRDQPKLEGITLKSKLAKICKFIHTLMQ